MGVVAMMMIPGNFIALQGEQPALFYGAGTATLLDSQGNEQYSQTIHNRLVDSGEAFLLSQTFEDGTTVADDIQVGAICISNFAVTIDELEVALDFDTDNTLDTADEPCKEDTVGDVAIASSIATVNPPTFTCGGTNCADGNTITGFAVCQSVTAVDTDFKLCGATGAGAMFAVIDLIPDITLATDETLDITYTFDVSSSGN